MKNEEAIKYLQQLYPYGGHCWLDEQRTEAIGMAIKSLQEEPVSIWHDASEEPNINYMIIYKCKGCTPDIGRFLGVAGIEGHFSWEIFKYPQSIIINNIEKWAYIDDITNL